MKHVQNELFSAFVIWHCAVVTLRRTYEILMTLKGRVSANSIFVHVHYFFIVLMDGILNAVKYRIK